MIPQKKFPDAQPAHWKLLKPTKHGHNNYLTKKMKNCLEIYTNPLVTYRSKFQRIWMPIFRYRCTRWRIFIRSFSNWGWWSRRSNINNSQLALFNIMTRFFIELHKWAQENHQIKHHVTHIHVLIPPRKSV